MRCSKFVLPPTTSLPIAHESLCYAGDEFYERSPMHMLAVFSRLLFRGLARLQVLLVYGAFLPYIHGFSVDVLVGQVFEEIKALDLDGDSASQGKGFYDLDSSTLRERLRCDRRFFSSNHTALFHF